MWKIGHFYILKDTEMCVIDWWLKQLDRHREQDAKAWKDKRDGKDSETDL
ncbi:hypothetical protein [Enterocloster clostridioformis]|nr:hypothetical protein [Enterocloster clostridioformis]